MSQLNLKMYPRHWHISRNFFGTLPPGFTEVRASGKQMFGVSLEASTGNLLMIYICNFHVLSNSLLICICKLLWNLRSGSGFISTDEFSMALSLLTVPLSRGVAKVFYLWFSYVISMFYIILLWFINVNSIYSRRWRCMSLLHGAAKDLPMMPADGGNFLLILLMKFLCFKIFSTDLHM